MFRSWLVFAVTGGLALGVGLLLGLSGGENPSTSLPPASSESHGTLVVPTFAGELADLSRSEAPDAEGAPDLEGDPVTEAPSAAPVTPVTPSPAPTSPPSDTSGGGGSGSGSSGGESGDSPTIVG